MYPLTSGAAKPLLPVANKPLLYYPLKTLVEAGVKRAIVVVLGESSAAPVLTYLQQYMATPDTSLVLDVVSVADDSGTADALRTVAPRLQHDTLVVLSADLITTVPLRALVVTHQLNASLASMMLTRRKTSPASETKSGVPPKGVDYIGLDADQQRVLFYASSSIDALKDLRVQVSVVKHYKRMTVSSDLLDMHCYVLSRSALSLLNGRPNISSIRYDLIPFLVRQQLKASTLLATARASLGDQKGSDDGEGSDNDSEGGNKTSPTSPGLPMDGLMHDSISMTHADVQGSDALVTAFLVPSDMYCARANTLQAYMEVHKEIASPGLSLFTRFTGVKASKYENVVPSSVTLGNKANIGQGCIVDENCTLGEKSLLKKTVVGRNCKVGDSSKITGCVLMDDVVVGDNCTLQNSIICSGAQIQNNCNLQSCQVGSNFVVAQASEHKGEVLAKT